MTETQLNATFSALSDPTRRAILARLAKGDASVMELAEPFELSQPAITKHLKVLENAGLISRDRQGQRRLSQLDAGPLENAHKWIESYRKFWEKRFEKLDELLENMKKEKSRKKKGERK